MKISALKCAVIGSNPVVRIVTDEDVDGYGEIEATKPYLNRRTGVSIAQTAIRWLIQRPGVSSVIIGARTEEQLKDNLGAAGWELTPDEVARLDQASARPPLSVLAPAEVQRIPDALHGLGLRPRVTPR
jgi:predicted oxidoreductase